MDRRVSCDMWPALYTQPLSIWLREKIFAASLIPSVYCLLCQFPTVCFTPGLYEDEGQWTVQVNRLQKLIDRLEQKVSSVLTLFPLQTSEDQHHEDTNPLMRTVTEVLLNVTWIHVQASTEGQE